MATPTEQVQYTSTIPLWARPYAERMLGQAEALSQRGYEQYQAPRLAGFNPLQQAAFGDLAAMQVSPYTGQAAGLASLAGQQAGTYSQYQPYQVGQFYQAPQYQGMGIGFERAQAPQGTTYQMGGPERVGAERFGLGAMQEYMSPYMQGVVEQQKRRAIQDYARQIPGLQAAGIRAGARGGTREAILQSEAQRNLQEQLGGIQATGLQNAYQQAAQQFGADRAAAMQAALANQAAGMQTGQTNLQALINQAQFGAGQGLQAQQLNQAAQLQAQQQALAQQQAMNQFAQQNAATAAQYGLAGAQMGEASRQFGANLGLQGLQQQLAAAGTLGGLGQQAYQQGLGISQAQLGAGAQIQGLEQQNLANQYQDWLNMQQLPFQQTSWFSDILRGIPSSVSAAQRYQSAPSTLGLIGGLATAGIGGLFGGFGAPATGTGR